MAFRSLTTLQNMFLDFRVGTKHLYKDKSNYKSNYNKDNQMDTVLEKMDTVLEEIEQLKERIIKLEKCIDPIMEDLVDACQTGDVDCLQRMRSQRSPEEFEKMLEAAVEYGRYNVVEYISTQFSAKLWDWLKLMRSACREGDLSMVKLLYKLDENNKRPELMEDYFWGYTEQWDQEIVDYLS